MNGNCAEICCDVCQLELILCIQYFFVFLKKLGFLVLIELILMEWLRIVMQWEIVMCIGVLIAEEWTVVM